MTFAILGWGSLLWDLDDLAPHVAGPWALRAGPRLPMEFSRISLKRRMGLVVALDPEAGRLCATSVIRSRRATVDEAVADLSKRWRARRSASRREYLRGHRGDSQSEAFRYIRNAPAATRTPLRRALVCDPWWRGLRMARSGAH